MFGSKLIDLLHFQNQNQLVISTFGETSDNYRSSVGKTRRSTMVAEPRRPSGGRRQTGGRWQARFRWETHRNRTADEPRVPGRRQTGGRWTDVGQRAAGHEWPADGAWPTGRRRRINGQQRAFQRRWASGRNPDSGQRRGGGQRPTLGRRPGAATLHIVEHKWTLIQVKWWWLYKLHK